MREFMMIYRYLAPVLLISLGWSGTSQAISDPQYEAIKQLGMLNGVALQCGFVDQTRLMKQGLVKALPKRRELGQAFDVVTNQSFLKFIEEEDSCPAADQFARQVDESLQGLSKAFSAN